VALDQLPTSVHSTPDGACLLLSFLIGAKLLLKAYRWATFGSTDGITIVCPDTFTEPLTVTAMVNRENVHIMSINSSCKFCSSLALDIAKKITDFDSGECHAVGPSNRKSPQNLHTHKSGRNEMANSTAIGGYSSYSVGISPIIKIIWLLKSLTFDPPLQYNPQEHGSLGYSTPSLSSDTTITSTNEKPLSLSVWNQQLPLPSHVDCQEEHKQDKQDTENQLSQDSINTLDKGGHLQHS